MRRWYAARVTDPEDIPMYHMEKLKQMNKKANQADFHIVQFFVDGLYAKIPKSKVESLGETSADKTKSKKDSKGYTKALKALKDENRRVSLGA